MDDFDLKCLPTDFVGSSRPSKVLQALYERKENEEKKVLEHMRWNQQKICQNYENLIEYQSNDLKKKLHDIRGLIKNELYDISTESNRDQANSIDKNQFNKTYRQIHEYTQKQHVLIETFYITLQGIEKNKSKELAEALKKAYTVLKDASLKPLGYWDEFIELELEKVNQTILCNNRNYIELKTQLQAEAQSCTKSAIQTLQQIKQNWVKIIREQAGKLYTSNVIEATKDLTKEVIHLGSSLTATKNPEEWLTNIRCTLTNLDQQAQKYLLNYKQAALIIYNRFFQELKSIEQDMACTEQPSQELSETYAMTLDDIVNTYDAELETIQETWNGLVQQLTITLDNTYRFLLTATTLWQKHFRRTAALQTIILKDVQNTIKLNDNQSQQHEAKLNILIDTIRQESSRDRLNKTLAEVSKVFTLLEDLYKAQHQTEVAVFKKYKTAHELKAELLMTEVKRFLELYPPDHEKDPKIQRKRASQTSEVGNPQDSLIPAQMFYCQFQIDAVSNWQFGLWESISNYTSAARAEIMAETEAWMQSHLSHLDKRLQIRLSIHAMRLDKIEKQIYEERLEELCLHQSRFEEHKIAFQNRLAALKNEYSSYTDKCENIVKAFQDEISHMEMTAVYTENSHAVLAKKPIVEAKTQKFLKDIEATIADYTGKYNSFVQHLKASHVTFLKNMKLFSEEGNFGLQEVKDFIKDIEKVEAQAERAIVESNTKLDAYKVTMCEAIRARTAQVQSALKSIAQEHKLNEIIKKSQEDINKELKRETENFQFKLEALIEQHDKSKAIMLENGCNYGSLRMCFDDTNDMVKKLNDIAEYLDEAGPVRFYSDKSNVELPPIKMSPRSPHDRVHELTKALFNMELMPDRNTFFVNLNKILQKYWDDILGHAKLFYKEHSFCFFLDEDMICHSFPKLMRQLYNTFYHMQNKCETRTMQDTKQFLHFAFNYLTFLECYIDDYVDEFTRKFVKQYEEFYKTEVMLVLNKEKIGVEEQYKQLHGKLKPLHGHPMNRNILEKLQIEAEIISSNAIELMADIKAPLLQKMDKEFDKIVDEYNVIKDIVPEIVRLTYNLKATIDPLSEKLNEKINLLKMVVDSSPVKDQTVISHCKSLLSLFGTTYKPPVPRSSWFVEMKSNDTSELSLSIIREPSLLREDSLSSAVPSLSTIGSDIFIVTLKEYHDKFSNELKKENLEETMKMLKAQWDCAVHRVMELYSVKYM